MLSLVYSKRYAMGFPGLSAFHAFDARRAVRSWNIVQKALGSCLTSKCHVVKPTKPMCDDDLRMVHSEAYVQRLRSSNNMARVLESPLVGWLPHRFVNWIVTTPMLYAASGSVIAAREAITGQRCAINFSGGFHHAKPDKGEGFCPISDIGIAVMKMRQEGLLAHDSQVLYVDTDAHLGNGVGHVFLNDDRVIIFDIYNSQRYPCGLSGDHTAIQRVDVSVPLRNGTGDKDYLGRLKSRFPVCIDDAMGSGKVGLVIYNAGTDVIAGDHIGSLGLSESAVLERDMFVLGEVRQRGLPLMMLPSGGYTDASHRLFANSVIEAVKRF